MRFDLTLYLVSDSTGLSEDEFLRRLEQALRGGVTLLQLREKNRTTLEYYELARKVKKLTDAYGVPLMIDDRVDIALAVDAAGVHVGAEDMPVREARRLMGPVSINASVIAFTAALSRVITPSACATTSLIDL